MIKKPALKATVPAKKPVPTTKPAPGRKPFEKVSAPVREPYQKVPGRKPYQTATTDADAELREGFMRFLDLHNARPVLACKGKVSANESEELGFLFARMLDDLEMPVPAEYSAGDPYQRDDVPLPYPVDFGPRKVPTDEGEYAVLNALLIAFMRRIARNPYKLRELYVAAQNDIEKRMWYRLILGQGARFATAMPDAH